MNKFAPTSTATVFCGIDVSARSLSVALIEPDHAVTQREFLNSASGHKALLNWLVKHGAKVRVSLESTGIYSLDLALALDAEPRIELAVLNPKLVNRFAQTLRRSKTDKADALVLHPSDEDLSPGTPVLAEYSQRMPFTGWQRPGVEYLRLRSISRYIESLVVDLTEVKNRLHTAASTSTTPRAVVADLKQAQAAGLRRLAKMRREAMKLVQAEEQLRQRFALLVSIPGIAEISALHILSELVLLPAEMTVRQWVAHSGLDPVHQESGTSLHRPSHISRAGNRHLRRALYMPSLSAARYDPHLRAFYRDLRMRHKTGLQALMAVERKLLHAIYGIFKSGRPYDGELLFPNIRLEVESIAG
jgi:transposase